MIHAMGTRETVLLYFASFDTLRKVLEDAPVSQGEQVQVEGFDSYYHTDFEETSLFGAEGYLDRLFTALIGVIEEHGLEENGWKRARWMVYDTSFVGPRCFEGRMTDMAYSWLCGWCAPKKDAISTMMDDHSEVVKRYNEMLPILPLGQ